jgi:hypothetical protein
MNAGKKDDVGLLLRAIPGIDDIMLNVTLFNEDDDGKLYNYDQEFPLKQAVRDGLCVVEDGQAVYGQGFEPRVSLLIQKARGRWPQLFENAPMIPKRRERSLGSSSTEAPVPQRPRRETARVRSIPERAPAQQQQQQQPAQPPQAAVSSLQQLEMISESLDDETGPTPAAASMSSPKASGAALVALLERRSPAAAAAAERRCPRSDVCSKQPGHKGACNKHGAPQKAPLPDPREVAIKAKVKESIFEASRCFTEGLLTLQRFAEATDPDVTQIGQLLLNAQSLCAQYKW